MRLTCAICEARRPRRFCPGVAGDICPTCCGTEREMTVSCPLDCEFLLAARQHDRSQPLVDPEQIPNRDIRVSEKFVKDHDGQLYMLGRVVAEAALAAKGLVDFDIREAFEALIRTYRTLQSGLYYESVPSNPLAAHLFRAVQHGIEELRRKEKESLGMSRTRDVDLLGMLVFLQRLELDHNNGRRLGRAFLSALCEFYVAGGAAADSPVSS